MLKKSRIAAQSSFDPLVYTFCDERDLLWHSLVFSAADRESAYVIDGLMHNDVVKSDIHSTDAFGYSEAIFGTSHLVGVSYAPRFKNLKRQRLYIFRSRQHLDRSEWKIKPTGYCDEENPLRPGSWPESCGTLGTFVGLTPSRTGASQDIRAGHARVDDAVRDFIRLLRHQPKLG